MKIATLLDSSYDEPSVYGPAPDKQLTIVTTTNTTSNSNNANNTKDNNFAITISNILISVALIVIGAITIFNRKLPKTAKIILLLGIAAVGALVLYCINNMPK